MRFLHQGPGRESLGVAAQRERLRVDRFGLALRDFEVVRLAFPLLLLAAVSRVLRVVAAAPLGLVRFDLPRLVVDFFVALRLVTAADRLPPAERFDLPRFFAAPLEVAFFLVERRFPR